MHTLSIPPIPVPLSRIALGAAMFGTAISRDDAWHLLDRFSERGGTCIDTANIYASWMPGGTGASETTIGEWIRSRNCRDTIVIMTKGGHYTEHTKPRGRLRPEELAADLEESMHRLSIAPIDLYWLHRDNPDIPVGEVLSALEEFRRSGKIRAAGCSNWTTERLREALAWARRHRIPGFVASQVWWSLARVNTDAIQDPSLTMMDDEMFSFHQQTALPVFAYSSQAGGYFRGSDKVHVQRIYDNPVSSRRREVARRIALARGVSPNQVALAWLLHQPFPTIPIVGCSNLTHLDDSLAADDVSLSPADVASLSSA